MILSTGFDFDCSPRVECEEKGDSIEGKKEEGERERKKEREKEESKVSAAHPLPFSLVEFNLSVIYLREKIIHVFNSLSVTYKEERV